MVIERIPHRILECRLGVVASLAFAPWLMLLILQTMTFLLPKAVASRA
jgi:hypothetical protein